uniref:AlNc14C71G4859 protein n=1 Tax=Albugo laibachii Nc14 TaxID=890382 RepID=F0WDZ1_9STRA|nr:AlNc14C71G4859 [Albugo laibachii Nc14]|eukprot:CCA19419.1 AlNc14C71G4859 [Albugo laibachii Nc14]
MYTYPVGALESPDGEDLDGVSEESKPSIAKLNPYSTAGEDSYSPAVKDWSSPNTLRFHTSVVVMDITEPMEAYDLMSFGLNENPSHAYLISALKHADLINWWNHYHPDLYPEHLYGIDYKSKINSKTSKANGSVDNVTDKAAQLQDILQSGCENYVFVVEHYEYLRNVPDSGGRGVLIQNKDDEEPKLPMNLKGMVSEYRFRIPWFEKPNTWQKVYFDTPPIFEVETSGSKR